MKHVWTGRVVQAAGKYGEVAPQATVCCNACRTCVTSNLLSIAAAGVATAGIAIARFARRVRTA